MSLPDEDALIEWAACVVLGTGYCAGDIHGGVKQVGTTEMDDAIIATLEHTV